MPFKEDIYSKQNERKIIEDLHKIIGILQKKIENLEQKEKERIEEEKFRTENQEVKLDDEVVAVGDGVFVLTIPNYRKHKVNSEKMHENSRYYLLSKPFYTEPNNKGYCLQLLVYPNGCGTGTGKYLGVYYALTLNDEENKENDAKYPFTDDVTFSIIDQYRDTEFKKQTLKTDGNPKVFKKPDLNKRNVSYGDPEFLDLQCFISTVGLMADNCIKIKIKIEPPPQPPPVKTNKKKWFSR